MPGDRWTHLLWTVSVLCLTWLGMMAVHELGHALGAWITGGEVTRVVLHPLAISRTDVDPNPRPLLVAWAGPLTGAGAPLLVFVALRWLGASGRWLAQFFAGSCLIANGLYLAVGATPRIGDAGDLVRLGAPPWVLWVFGMITTPLGLWLWHGLGPRLGFGAAGRVGPRAACGAAAVLIAALCVCSLFGEAGAIR